MAKVFISHASEDIAVARELHQWLIEGDHEVFLDQDLHDGIPVGAEWKQQLLQKQLRWSNAMVCVVTSAYVESSWCSAEVRLAQSLSTRLLPVRAEPGIAHGLLKSIQHTDLTPDRETARAALTEALRRVDEVGDPDWPDDRSPFPGLSSFDIDLHRVFFARDHEVEQLAELLRSTADERADGAALLVVGPSGCGKSSLLRAGLLPVMAGEPGWWTLRPIMPGADPVAALARELATASRELELNWTVEHIRHQLDEGCLTGLAEQLLLAALGSRSQRLLVVVDQFEELLTRTGPEDRARFADLVRPALTGPVRMVGTLRTEFLDQLLSDSALATLSTDIHPLRPLHRDALRRVIEKPAELAGIAVDEHLVTQLVEDTEDGNALPLLAFTLAQLADGINRGGRLPRKRYEELGGVQGALARQADAALAEATTASGRSPEKVIAGLMQLITVDEQGRPTRYRVSRDLLPAPVIAELDAFVTRRLVTTDTDNGNVVIEVAHEAFLSAWPPLAQAIRENHSALRARRAVEQAATEWNGDDRPPSRLWERGQLAAAVTETGARIRAHDVVTDRVELSSTARVFLRTSIRRDRIRRGRAVTVLSVLLVLALAAAGIAVFQQRVAEHQRNVALSQKVAGQSMELRATNPALAAQLSLAAYRLIPTTEAHSSLLSTFADPYSTRLTDHTNHVYSVAFSPDSRMLATAGREETVRLWDASDPQHPQLLGTLSGHKDTVSSVVFSPDGRTLVTTSWDGTARLWDIRDPIKPSPLSTVTGHRDSLVSAVFTPDGRILVTASIDDTALLWDIHDPGQPRQLGTVTADTKGVVRIALSRDGYTLATAGVNNTARLWDLHDPTKPSPLGTLIGHSGAVTSVAFSPDGHTLATASYDRTARLWDIHDPRKPSPLGTPLLGHANTVSSVAFSPDGNTLATGSNDNTAQLWIVQDPRQPIPLGKSLTGHTNVISSVAFSPDGRTVATASHDNSARLWTFPGPVIAGHTSSVSGVAFSPDGHTLATTSADLTARLWDIRNPSRPSQLGVLTGHTGFVTSVAFSPDGNTLATTSFDRTARLWDIRDSSQPSPLSTLTGHAEEVYAVAFSPDGRTLATASNDESARLWDIQNLRQPSPLSTVTDHTREVNAVAFSPDGHTLATVGNDEKENVRLWDISNLRQPSQLSAFTGHAREVDAVAFSPDGHTLATASYDTTARLWDIHNLRQPSALSTLIGHTDAVYSVAFRSDSSILATGSHDGTALLWDIRNLREPSQPSRLTGHTREVYEVAFSRDGHTLATASIDNTARLWETDDERVADRVCDMAWPPITKDEWNQYLPDVRYQLPCS